MLQERTQFVALGYCSNDHLCQLPGIPDDGKIEMTHYEIQGGGPAASASVGAVRLGLSSSFIGSVGDDGDGMKIISDLRAAGVCTEGMCIRRGAVSGVACCLITPDGKRSIAWSRGDASLLKAGELPEELIRHAEILHLDGHQPDAAVAAAGIARESGVLVSLDAGTFTPRIEELLGQCDLLIASRAFAAECSGESDIAASLNKLHDLYPRARVVAVTMGADGSAALGNGGAPYFRPAFHDLQIVDTTGAGDAYHCGFAVEYHRTGDLAGSMAFATAFAGLKCRKFGSRAGLPSRREVEEYLRSH